MSTIPPRDPFPPAQALAFAEAHLENSKTGSIPKGKAALTAVLISMVLFSVIAGYSQSLSGMALYDDEGTLIRWVRDVISGQPLYDTIQTPYGPLYFAYEWLAHAPLGIPVSHDSVRFVTSFFRVAAVLLVFLLCHKLSGSVLISWAAGIVAFGELSFLSREPAHPQELCIALLLALALAGCYTANRVRLMLTMGALAGGMALTKINIGIFAVAAMGVVFAFSTKPSPLWTGARAAVAGCAILLPAALMNGMFGQSWAVRYCALETISIVAALVVLWRVTARTPFDLRLGVRDFLTSAVGFAIAVLLISGFAIARGSSFGAMLECLVIGPRRAFGPMWFVAAHVVNAAVAWAAVCLGLGWTVSSGRWNASLIASLKLLLALLVFGCCLADRSAILMNYGLPLLWLVAIPSDPSAGSHAGSFSRALLMMLTVIQFLYAFPVAGEQMPFMEILPIVVAAVCLADAIGQLEIRRALIWTPANRKTATIVAGALLASISCFIAGESLRLYLSRPALQLPGASLIHLNARDTRARQEIVRLVRADSCATLVSIPGMPSFNEWTGVRSPSSQPGGPWIQVMNAASQINLARQLSGDTYACVVIDKQSADLWSEKYVAYSSPMARFIRENFRTEFDSAGYLFLVRR
uniref:Glycosyltransferase RgtA/B/C/D-like domain-containing protein n=1 Tax=Solibacter usitatus (strain Ellin6076) TaxID=234267 RepID=Q025S6_SOLUE